MLHLASVSRPVPIPLLHGSNGLKKKQQQQQQQKLNLFGLWIRNYKDLKIQINCTKMQKCSEGSPPLNCLWWGYNLLFINNTQSYKQHALSLHSNAHFGVQKKPLLAFNMFHLTLPIFIQSSKNSLLSQSKTVTQQSIDGCWNTASCIATPPMNVLIYTFSFQVNQGKVRNTKTYPSFAQRVEA